MNGISTIQEAEEALRPYVPLVAQLTGKDMTLGRISKLMAMLGNPQDKIKVVHIAGTSGKTSTAYYMAALLQQTGKKVGLTVSPHIDSVTERVQINGQPLDEQDFCRYLGDFLEIVRQMSERPSYFELLYAFSFYVFDLLRMDYAVIETGMGGLHDATNIAQQPDKVCIITDIGYDHMHILGNTLSAITAQKAGIIHARNVAFMYEQDVQVMEPVRARVQEKQADLQVIQETKEQGKVGALPDSMPTFQQHNWLLAYAAYRYVAKRDDLPQLNPEQLLASQTVSIPARMEEVAFNSKILVMDGAHNLQKMTTFLASFQHKYPGAKPAVLLALKQSKESQGLGKVLAPVVSRVIVTSFHTSQDLPAVAVEPFELARSLAQEGIENVVAIADQHEAFKQLMASEEKLCIITGSFYLLSQLRTGEGIK